MLDAAAGWSRAHRPARNDAKPCASFAKSRFHLRGCVSASLCAIGDAVSLCGDDDGSHGVLHQSVDGRVPRNLEWTDQARGPAKASIAFPQRLKPAFFPCREVTAFPAE